MQETINIAVIGGSGLYAMEGLIDKVSYAIDTPFGKPSGDIIVGNLHGKRVAFLPRHGVGHYHTPSTIPYRANIYALKTLGVRFVIAVNACGSLREDYAPGDIVIPDQLYDHTKLDRGRSFFDQGLVGHISVADPLCPQLSEHVFRAVEKADSIVHRGGTFITIEGPRFSTRGESNIFRQWGCSLIGMTTCPEAFLAAEAEMSYTTMAHVTDYDVWHVNEEPVTVDKVVETFQANLNIAQKAIAVAVETLDETAVYPCHTVLTNAIMTDPQFRSQEVIERLRPILHRILA